MAKHWDSFLSYCILQQLKCNTSKEKFHWFAIVFTPWKEEAGQANCGYAFLVQPSSQPLISRYQLNHQVSIFEILGFYTTNIYLSKLWFVYLQSK